MEEVGPKKSIPLSMDRAVFLLLRVKKAFKKKRYLRKDKPTQTVGSLVPSQSRSCNKIPPPLLRSRTLPAIMNPGIPVLPSNTDNSHIYSDDRLRAAKCPGVKYLTTSNKTKQSIKSKKSLVLPGEDSSIVERRKSTDTPCVCPKWIEYNSYAYQCEQLSDISNTSRCAGENGDNNNDGSLLLRIPSPSVLAAKAYRLPQSKTGNLEEHNKKLNYYSRDYNTKTINTESTTNAPLNRLAQYLHQTSTKSSPNDYIFPAPSEPVSDEVPRRLSWERRHTNIVLKRSASINSVIEAFWSNSPRPSLDISRPFITSFNKRPSTSSLLSNCSTISQNAQLNINYNEVGSSSSAGSSRRESILSPSSTRKNKLKRVINDNVVKNNENNIVLRSDRNLVDKKKTNEEKSIHRFDDCSDYSNNHKSSFPKDLELSYDSSLGLNETSLSLLNSKSLRAVVTRELENQAEMEYLIPNGGVTLLSSNLNVISRNQTPFSKMSQPKNVKLNAADTCCDENISLSTKFHEKGVLETISGNTNTRSKGGNTPHRSKMSKKQLKTAQAQLDKYTQTSVHLHALFSAVEHGHLEKARTILESTDVDINSLNSDGLSTLDVAVLSNNRSMTKMLLQHGALEGSQFSTDSLGTKLNALLKDAESRVQDLNGPDGIGIATAFTPRPSISSIIIGNTSSSVTGCTGNEIDKQIGIWERRVKGLRRVLLGWDQARPPDAPSLVTVDVTGENSITVHLMEPAEGAIATKFEVQWSTRLDFNNIVGKRQIMEWISFQGTMGSKCHISGLTQGRRYFIRAMCGNVKGWGLFKTSVPVSVVPSSWRDISHCQDRYLGRQRLLDNLFTAVRLARPADASDLTLDSSTVQRRNPKKKTTIKQLFSVASKFQKNLRRGIYLSSIIYCDDKVLVTNEDFLPVIEIDETYPSTLHIDYHWLMKVACSWDDVRSLRSDMERNSTSAVHFRTKLLSAVCHMQSALGITDLGMLYYKPLRDTQGTIVLTSVLAVRTQKAVSILNTRWLPVSKLQKKIVAIHEDYNISEKLILSVGDQIHYHQSSMQHLEPGLYLGYLKMQCSVEQIQVVVPVKTPNVLPHCKVRDNSHVNAEEWQILKRRRDKISESATLPQPLPVCFNANSSEKLTEAQQSFLYDLAKAIRKLLNYMNIPAEDASTHRLYDLEVIEHSKGISFLIICPSVELICAAPGQPEILLQNDHLISLSIQAFEMIHLNTYQPGIVQKYSRLSCVLELDMSLANHSQREAFSSSELQTAKERLSKLQELTTNLNSIWKSVRWLMDVIAFARDKNLEPPITLQGIIEIAELSKELRRDSCNQPSLLQLPVREGRSNKCGSGRGSWPGPANSSQAINMEVEHSKSEQNLGRNVKDANVAESSEPQQVSAIKERGAAHLLPVGQDYRNIIDISLQKSSAESITSECTVHSSYSTTDSEAFQAVPPSHSADIITFINNDAERKSTGRAIGKQRKRTNSNLAIGSNQELPVITISHSVPHLSSKPKTVVSSLSLKMPPTRDFENSADHHKIDNSEKESSSRTKAISSINLRDGGVYLRSTLSALQCEIKSNPIESQILKSPSSKSLSHQSSEEDSASGSSIASEQSSGIIQVYTAYNTGLASGTSLKLHVTPKTTAREVINLVVKQLNMAAVLKGDNGPIYTSEMLDNFCLVAVIGARERCLRDDFKPLHLQNPWRKGRLYVRQKHELLAAIEHSNRKSQII